MNEAPGTPRVEAPPIASVGWVAVLRGFAGARPEPAEHCELCSLEIASRHAHLIEPETRRMLCVCQACALLFSHGNSGRYRRVSGEVVRLDDFVLPDALWERFAIPVNLAFFFVSSAENRVLALYPGPAGATESTLELAAWDALAAANSTLGGLAPDVEALLVHRVGETRAYYRVPIDRCYELAGTIRAHWHGISGGPEAREAIARFFSALDEEAAAAGAMAETVAS
jgi:hypothetical protein